MRKNTRKIIVITAVSVAIVLVVLGSIFLACKVKDSKNKKMQNNLKISAELLDKKNYDQVISLLGDPERYSEADKPVAYLSLAQAYYGAKDYQRAIEIYSKLVDLQSNESSKSLYENFIANAYRDEKKFDSAIEHYNLATKYNEKNTTAWVNLICLYLSQSDVKNAEKSYDLALNKNPSSSEITKLEETIEDAQ